MSDLELVARGEESYLDCVIVFSARNHVEYIENILWVLEKQLKKSGYKPIRLDKETRSGEGYLEKILTFIKDTSLGVVILDGLRPNATLEMGM